MKRPSHRSSSLFPACPFKHGLHRKLNTPNWVVARSRLSRRRWPCREISDEVRLLHRKSKTLSPGSQVKKARLTDQSGASPGLTDRLHYRHGVHAVDLPNPVYGHGLRVRVNDWHAISEGNGVLD